VEGTGLVLLEQVILLRHLLLLLGVWEVVAEVGGTVVDWHSQELGIASVGSYVAVHQEDLCGPSPMLGECFLQCLRLRSLRVP
jgi:hypothetical protein